MTGAEPAPAFDIIIPARFSSTRFPGKPLARLIGADGLPRTLIEHSWRAAQAVTGARRILVATDDRSIAEIVERFGGEAVMTPAECANGTARCAAAAASREDTPDIVVNLQGDAPLTPPHVVEALVQRLLDDPGLPAATAAVACRAGSLHHLLEDQRAGRVGGTTVVFNAHHDALYFSKRVIPYVGDGGGGGSAAAIFLHLGVYAYRRAALADYPLIAEAPAELQEGLEQLRFLHAGIRVGVVVCEAPSWEIIELNNPGDITLIEAQFRRRGAIRAAE